MHFEGRDLKPYGDPCFAMERERSFASVLEYERALDLLLACSLRRHSWDQVLRAIPPFSEPGGADPPGG